MTTERLEEGYRTDLATVAPVHDVDDHQVVVDFPHNVLDNYRTDWAPGCFDESFAKRLPVMVWNHNADMLIGAGVRTENLGDKSRVVQRFANFDAVPQARAAHSMISDGIVPGFSFHFRNGRTVAHPDVRGARRFLKADMLEVSPVTFPSIPGAIAVGIRSQEAPALEIPTIDEIFALQDRGVLEPEGVRSLIAEHYPHLREHIKVTAAAPAEPTVEEKVAGLLGAEHGLRDLTIHIGSDGTVSTSDPEGHDTGSDGGDDDEDAATLASAVDAALDEACRLLDAVDTTTLPDTVQQAVALVQAAGVAVDELLDVMGLSDPDEDGSIDDTGDRATLSADEEKKLSDSDFAYIDSNGGRHLPIHDASHVRNALARFDQTHFESDDAKKAAKAKIDAAAKKFGIGQDSGSRSDEPVIPEEEGPTVSDEEIAAALERLARH